jgi:hypothetical protein
MLLLNKSKNKSSSRRQINIKEVKDSILILPQNQYRIVIETSSINFELKSEEEQDVLIDSFQNFLNSLPCQIQILIRVREVDIDHYLEVISQSKQQEKETIYKDQINNYCSFIKNLVSGNKILSRRFYIVITYQNLVKNKDFYLIKEQIHLNRDIVMRGIEKLGMKARQLNSLEILDLFYGFYNPHQAKIQQLQGKTIEMVLKEHYDQTN